MDWTRNQEDQSEDCRGMIFVLIKTESYSIDMEIIVIDSRFGHYNDWNGKISRFFGGAV